MDSTIVPAGPNSGSHFPPTTMTSSSRYSIPSENTYLLPSHEFQRISVSNNTPTCFKMGRLASVTTLGVVTTFIFLSFSATTQQGQAASILQQKAPSPDVQERLQILRQLSKEAGLPQPSSTSNEDVCLDPGCLDAAFDILSAMNGTVNPCSDFFEYSCGRWLANNPVPPSASRWSRFNGLRDGVNNITQKILNEEENSADAKPINQVKQFFQTCLDLEAIERVGLGPLQTIVSEFGGWQLLNPGAWNASAFDWLKAVAETRRRTLQSAVISVYVSADIKNTVAQTVYLDQPSFGLPRGILITPENYTELINAYETFIFEVAKELGSTQTEAQLRAAAQDMIALEVKLAKISSSEEDRYDMERIYNPYTLSEYQSVTDAIDESRQFTIQWKTYLDQVFSSSGVSVGNDEPIVVNEVDYVKKLIPILKDEEQKGTTTIANYIVWRLVSGLVGDTTANMRNITFRFQQALTGATEPAAREVTCANAAISVFGMAIGVKYIEAAFDKGAKDEMNVMVDNLLISFKEMIGEAAWMQNVTKEQAVAKVNTIRSFMAYPDWLEDKDEVEAYYAGLELGSGHFDSQLKLALYRMEEGLKGLRKPTNRDEWIMYPGVVNAGYSPEFNSITFPAGILQPPFFGGNRPKHQNYGGIGVVIGHEITHGFDNQGAQFDKDGNAENWWDDETKAEYDNRAKCMSDQYSAFHAEAAGLNVNGDLTLGENIADNGGLRESFRAYQKYVGENGPELRLPGLEELSVEQLFFLGYANIWCESITREGLINQILTDPHSPAEFRVKGPVRNSDDFAKAYDCPVDGSGMNPPPEDKCTVW